MLRNWGGVGIVGGGFSDWVLLMFGLPEVGVMVPIDADEVVLEVGEADVVAFGELIGKAEEGTEAVVSGVVEFILPDGDTLGRGVGAGLGMVEFKLDEGDTLGNGEGVVSGVVELELDDGDPLGNKDGVISGVVELRLGDGDPLGRGEGVVSGIVSSRLTDGEPLGAGVEVAL